MSRTISFAFNPVGVRCAAEPSGDGAIRCPCAAPEDMRAKSGADIPNASDRQTGTFVSPANFGRRNDSTDRICKRYGAIRCPCAASENMGAKSGVDIPDRVAAER